MTTLINDAFECSSDPDASDEFKAEVLDLCANIGLVEEVRDLLTTKCGLSKRKI